MKLGITSRLALITAALLFVIMFLLVVAIRYKDEAIMNKALLNEVGEQWMECSSDLELYKNLNCSVVSAECCEQCFDALASQTYSIIIIPECERCNAELARRHEDGYER